MKHLTNNRGSMLILGIGFLSIYLVAIFSLGHSMAQLKQKRNLLNYCREETSSSLKQIKGNFRSVLNLNPMALLLRQQWIQVNIEITAATALLPKSLPVLTKLIAKRSQIFAKRKNLDDVQKMFLKLVDVENQKYKAKMFRRNNKISSVFSYQKTGLFFTQVEKGALKPDSADIAPIYELSPYFENETKLVFSWNVEQLNDDIWIENDLEKILWSDQCGFYLDRDLVVRPFPDF